MDLMPENQSPVPFVSVLLAVRNEALFIEDCLTSLRNQNYAHFEILVGDDDSDDETWDILSIIAAKDPRIRPFKISTQLGRTKGKANVLAHLAHYALGDYFLITDADMRLVPTWIAHMVPPLQKDQRLGFANGFTLISSQTVFGQLQRIDWALGLGTMTFFDWIGKPVTCMGNNMIISKKAYFQTGGYEQIPFSVTEDYALFNAARTFNWGFRQYFNPKILGISMPVDSWAGLVKQRKRWLSGAMEVPAGVFILSLILIFIPLLAWINVYFLLFWLFKCAVQMLCYTWVSLAMKQVPRLWIWPLYELYSLFLTVHTAWSYRFGGQIEWKKRNYNKPSAQ